MSIIDINSVHWVIAATAEAPWQSCRRLGIGYSPVVDDVLPWNNLALDAALNSLGRNLTPIAQTAYGIDGCCVPSLWCGDSGCFTQSSGSYFVNYGVLQNSPNILPVYACIQSDSSSFILDPSTVSSLSSISCTSSSALPSLSNTDLDIRIGPESCDNPQVCSSITCTQCSADQACPMGSTCLYSYGDPIGSCFINCGGYVDQSCPCDTSCQELYGSGGVLNFCSSASFNSAGDVCASYGGLKLQCSSPRLAQSEYLLQSNLTAVVAIKGSTAVTYAATTLLTLSGVGCTVSSDCFDGNLCSSDSCVDGVCRYSAYAQCGSSLSSIRQRLHPREVVLISNPSAHSSQSILLASVRLNGTTSSASFTDDVPVDYISYIGFRSPFFGNTHRSIGINANGVVHFPPFLPCTDVIETYKCITFSTLSNVASIWPADWAAASLSSGSISYLSEISAFHVLYINVKQTSDPSKNTFGLTIDSDGSLTFHYVNIASATTATSIAGAWAASVSASDTAPWQKDPSMHAIPQHLMLSGTDVAMCLVNALGCSSDACVSPSSPLVVQWSGSSCSAASKSLQFSCEWAGGVAYTPATLSSDAAGNTIGLSCPVPVLDFAPGAIIKVALNASSIFGLIEDPVKLTFLYGMTLAAGELSSHEFLVRYHSAPVAACGCSALSELPGLSCDACGVCGGDGSTKDCNGTCFGSAYLWEGSTCVAGMTRSYPSFIETGPVVPKTDEYLYNLISLIVLVGFFFMILMIICLCLRLIVVGQPAGNDNEMVVMAFNVANTLGIRRILLNDRQLAAIGEHTYSPLTQRQNDSLGDGEPNCEECSICLCDFQAGDRCRTLPAPCEHTFHKGCIDEWFASNSNCPLCKRSIYRIMLDQGVAGDPPVGQDEQHYHHEEELPRHHMIVRRV